MSLDSSEKNAFLLIHFYLNSLEVFFHVNISLVNFVHRKAVRAAIFLLPLLGIANLIFLFFHQFDEAWKYALWSYTAHFFASFQGFFVAVLYCFLNGEVGYWIHSLSIYSNIQINFFMSRYKMLSRIVFTLEFL